MLKDKELEKYARTLPEIYREILSAFPRVEPNRKAGYGLAFQTLAADFAARDKPFLLGDIIQACERLEEKRFVEIKHRIFVHPTEEGERLISAVTGLQPAGPEVPPLPALPA